MRLVSAKSPSVSAVGSSTPGAATAATPKVGQSTDMVAVPKVEKVLFFISHSFG